VNPRDRSPSVGAGVREQVLLRLYPSSIIASLNDMAKPNVFLVGGRGFGKSVVLRRAAEAAKAAGRKLELIDGRDWESALETFRDLARKISGQGGGEQVEKGLRDLYFDDLDYFIKAVDDFAPDRRDQAIEDLYRVASTLAGRKRRCVVSSTLYGHRLQNFLLDLRSGDPGSEKVISAASLFFTGFDAVWLKPWEGEWKTRIGGLVEKHLGGLTPSARELSEKLIVELTGGHPALLSRSFEHLGRLLETEGSILARRLTSEKSAAEVATAVLERDLRTYLEDSLLQKGIGSLRRALVRLRTSEEREIKAAHLGLLAFARGQPLVLPARSRDILLGEGLLFRDPGTSGYAIPGELFRKELVFEGGGGFTVQLQPDPVEPDRQGIAIARDDVRQQPVRLSGGPWSVLQVLFAEAPRFVSLDELRARTHLQTENAVRSAIQRLTADLRSAGVEGLVENQYGKGYRKGESPGWAAAGAQPPVDAGGRRGETPGGA
jgi:DNA-binding winged helix-turn-helix (wHTH) protein